MTQKKTAKKTANKSRQSDPKPKTTAEALFCVARSMMRIGIDKAEYNKTQKFHFRSIDQALITLSPMLIDAGLIMTPTVLSQESSEIHPIAQGKGVTHKATVSIRYDFRLASSPEDVISATFVGQGLDSYDKALNKAASACLKYMIFQTFCVPVKGCDDSDGESNDEQILEADSPADKRFDDFENRIEKAKTIAVLMQISQDIATEYGIGKAPPRLGEIWKTKRNELKQAESK